MNLYTKLLCKLGLIKAPTLDIVQWIKDNPENIRQNIDWVGDSEYIFTYKLKEFVSYERAIYVNGVEHVFTKTEAYVINLACQKAKEQTKADILKRDKEYARKLRKELLE